MKFLRYVALCSLVWLAGCASHSVIITPEPPAPATKQAPTAVVPEADARRVHTPIIPGGELLPITPAQAASDSVVALAPPADLWDRIRRGFRMPDLDNSLVRDREQWYGTRPDYIQRMTERSSKYLFHVVEELERRNMPTELALLPFIESAFNPQAVSRAKAVGMWQFMPATGKHFELKQNAFRDDRRDVLASTRAALDYLQKLYTMFGDWHLALAAYNWGEGSVARAIAKNRLSGRGTGYGELTMPMETRFYVPKLQAMKNIAANPQAFRVSLPDIGNHPYFQSVDIAHDIDVALAAKLAEIAIDNFRELNPSLNRPVILAAGTPQILLPWDNAAIFQRNLESYTAGPLASWTVWLVPTTMKPAEAAKRTGMSEGLLRGVNKIPQKMIIKAGSSLLVSRSVRLQADVTGHLADNGQLSLASEARPKHTPTKAGKTTRHSKAGSKGKPASQQARGTPKTKTRAAKQ